MSLRACDSLHPGIGSRLAWRVRQRWAVICRRAELWSLTDTGREAQWFLAIALAGVAFGVITQLIRWMEP